ncbi:hypothetical protein FRC01_002669 [Tulasnella sp. 417]|nr:hypothetical protein FRC01_002669 [Tulasnella sp. 417]
MVPPQQQVLSMPECLSMIFMYLDRHSLTLAARVCHRWEHPAVKELWKDLPSPFPLLKLLGPMINDRLGWKFTGNIQRPDWDHWSNHTRPVRSLCIDDRESNLRIHQDALLQLQPEFSAWGWTQLLPRLTFLQLNIQAKSMFPFTRLVTSSLKTLLITVTIGMVGPDLRLSMTNAFLELREMATVMKLHTFHIIVPGRQSVDLTRALIAFVCSQPSLRSLKLYLGLEAYPIREALTNITSLKTLLIHAKRPEPAECREILDLIQLCPDLEELFVVEDIFRYWNHIKFPSFSLPRSWLGCHGLKMLKCRAVDLATLTPEIVQEMGEAWPHMEILHLFNNRKHNEPEGIAPWFLHSFAAAFSATLLNLGVTIDFTLTATESRNPPTASRFTKLETLHVSNSIIEPQNMQPFAELLSACTGSRGVHVVCDRITLQGLYERYWRLNIMVADLCPNGGLGAERDIEEMRPDCFEEYWST